jgi:hypothetical protein
MPSRQNARENLLVGGLVLKSAAPGGGAGYIFAGGAGHAHTMAVEREQDCTKTQHVQKQTVYETKVLCPALSRIPGSWPLLSRVHTIPCLAQEMPPPATLPKSLVLSEEKVLANFRKRDLEFFENQVSIMRAYEKKQTMPTFFIDAYWQVFQEKRELATPAERVAASSRKRIRIYDPATDPNASSRAELVPKKVQCGKGAVITTFAPACEFDM